eukprot:TRINITY_DN12073_c0_g2_i1.p3 TRINITY_DN12073_c0_g2~~TRINITY_DN12073_c0_g2_i1.p3  ORF type:complete len:221 (-),score=19.81 TRINITY_DN12073_c0_g2_i1:936-1598(-)
MVITEFPGDVLRVAQPQGGFEKLEGSEQQSQIQQDPRLQFKVIYADGGCFSEGYGYSNLLQDNSLCYCSLKKEGANLCIEQKYQRSFTITGIDIAAPNIGYTCPLGQGVIFSSWNRPDDQLCEMFNKVNSVQEFQECVRQYQYKLQQHSGIDEDEIPQPIMFFDLRGQYHQEYHLGVPRSGRYILIKLLRSRNCGENIDVRYIGFRGFDNGFSSPSAEHA